MKKLSFLVLLSVLVGCSEPAAPEVQPQPTAPVQPVAPPPAPETPAPPVPQVPLVAPSADFMNGYWDGYTGRWVSPIKWVFTEEYRNGHQIGSDDRRAKVQPRYPRPGKMNVE